MPRRLCRDGAKVNGGALAGSDDKFGNAAELDKIAVYLNRARAMSNFTTIVTNVEDIRDAVIRAGFRPGRWVEVTVKYADAEETSESETIPSEHADQEADRLEKLLAMEGVGSELYGPRSQEDIDAQVRKFRGGREATTGSSTLKILRGDELPPILADSFSDIKPDDMFVVQARRLSVHDAAKLAALRADVQLGLDDIAAGRVTEIDPDTFFEEIIERCKAKHRE
jgi:hypothetical protein